MQDAELPRADGALADGDEVLHALRSTIQYVDALKPAADAGVGKNERKRLAAQTLDRADIAIIERERAALNVQRIDGKAAA